MSRNNIRSNNLENWNAKANQQVDDHTYALLCVCDHPLHRSYLIEATVDAKRASRDCNVEPELNPGCNITVDRSLVNHVFIPQNRVDALNQATEAGPGHEQASSRIPSFKVPVERNDTHDKANEREDGIDLICKRSRVHWHCNESGSATRIDLGINSLSRRSTQDGFECIRRRALSHGGDTASIAKVELPLCLFHDIAPILRQQVVYQRGVAISQYQDDDVNLT